MRAAEYDAYGPTTVLQVREVPRPTPGIGELLVRVRAAALNPKDVLVRSGKLRLLTGRRFPKRVGFDWAGEIARTLIGSPKARLVVVRPRARDLSFLAERAAEGRLVPVVDRVYPLDRIAEAEEHAGSKHARGKVVVQLD